MSKVLTIIIPTYNMERYIKKCLSSLVIKDQHLMMLLEVLIINDGAKDKSGEISHDFENNYPGIFKVIDKENGNYGSCINRGLKEASGKYIKVLDADDSFNSESFAVFIQYLSEIDTDLILSDFAMVDMNSGNYKIKHYDFIKNQEYSFKELLSVNEMWMHAVTYRTANLIAMNYSQTEGISYTDQEWIFTPMSSVRSFYCFPYVLYHYTIGREGQTVDPKVFAKKFNEEILGFKVMMEEYLSISCEADNLSYLFNRLYIRAKTIYIFSLHSHLGSIDFAIVQDFDKYLHNKSDSLYHLTENINVPIKFILIKIVKLWRLYGKAIYPILWLLHIYKKIRQKITVK